MSSITVRNLGEPVKRNLRLRVARHGWSMEQEVRQILQQTRLPAVLDWFARNAQSPKIAAIAMARGFAVVTRNIKDFENIDGLNPSHHHRDTLRNIAQRRRW